MNDLLIECVYSVHACARARSRSPISRNKNKTIDKKERNRLSSNWLASFIVNNDRLGGAHPLTIAIVVISVDVAAIVVAIAVCRHLNIFMDVRFDVKVLLLLLLLSFDSPLYQLNI